MSRDLMICFGAFEDLLVRLFHQHPIYENFKTRFHDKEAFVEYLIQIGFIAANFVKWYETAKLAMGSEDGKEVIRNILRDEIPAHGPTHQDNRFYDLTVLLGADPSKVLNTPPSEATARTVERLFALVRYPQAYYDLRVMVALRVAGEVLVAEQYRHIVEVMRDNFGINPEDSCFYFPHYVHDLKGGAEELGSGEVGHADSFDAVITSMIDTTEALGAAVAAATLAYEVRSGIHDQFV